MSKVESKTFVPELRFPEFLNGGSWENKLLGECLLGKPEYGINAPAVPYSHELPTYLRITDILENGQISQDNKVSVERDVIAKNYLDVGDIVLARTGASVGKSYKYREKDGKLVFAGFLIRIKPDERKLNSELLFQYLFTDQYWKWVSVNSARSGQPGINGNEYSLLSIPVPTQIEEQQKVADCLSSLDDHNAISVASHLAQLLKAANGSIKTVISSHHALFFNVMWNELNEKGKLQPYFLKHDKDNKQYSLKYTRDTPFFHHVALLEQLHQASESGSLFTYHFTILRSILEKTATFHGFNNFSACIKKQANDPEGILHARLVNILSHGNYSLFEPVEMTEENKGHFRNILSDFMENYRFNPDLFPDLVEQKTVTEQ
ncbi:restriction endonuclease subunit S [Vibrio sp. K4]|uniref:restriction endonuclease subunit S n=1 Tax=Vibrio sp. K4 TaxID=3391579 RepID=UPI003DA72CF2